MVQREGLIPNLFIYTVLVPVFSSVVDPSPNYFSSSTAPESKKGADPGVEIGINWSRLTPFSLHSFFTIDLDPVKSASQD